MKETADLQEASNRILNSKEAKALGGDDPRDGLLAWLFVRFWREAGRPGSTHNDRGLPFERIQILMEKTYGQEAVARLLKEGT